MIKENVTIMVIPHSTRQTQRWWVRYRTFNPFWKWCLISAAMLLLIAMGYIASLQIQKQTLLTKNELLNAKIAILQGETNALLEKTEELAWKVQWQNDRIAREREEYLASLDDMRESLMSMRRAFTDMKVLASLKLGDKSAFEPVPEENFDGEGGFELDVPEVNFITDITGMSETRMTEEIANCRSSLEDNIFAEIEQMKGFLGNLKDLQDALTGAPSLNPTLGKITSEYGYRINAYSGKYHFHKGIDIANAIGTPVIAPAEGVVIFAGDQRGYGRTLTIQHANNFQTYYAHLNGFNVLTGDHVSAGSVIGYIGDTGKSSGPHLHYEVRVNDQNIDPTPYLKTFTRFDASGELINWVPAPGETEEDYFIGPMTTKESNPESNN
jgi:murein DD-endopeptidase MepM/ murein hydrolase activator NlpD